MCLCKTKSRYTILALAGSMIFWSFLLLLLLHCKTMRPAYISYMRTQIVPAFPKKSSRGQGCEQNSPKNTVHVEGTTFKNVDESSYMLNLSEKHFVELTNMRVLLFVTTHMPDLHAKALKWVWPNTVIASSLLTHADVLFYTAKDIEMAKKCGLLQHLSIL